MKKLLLSLALCLSLFTATTKRAEAFVVPGGYAVGLAIAQVSMLSIGVVAITHLHGTTPDGIPRVPWWMMIPLAVGMIILDSEQEFSYSGISAADGAKLALTPDEIVSFNNEIDEVNFLVSYVSSEAAKMEKPTSEEVVVIWNGVKDAISPEAFSAMQKVTAQLYK